MSEERLEIIKENVYMRSEIAKISRLGIDTSLGEELELLKEIDRLNNIINETRRIIGEYKHYSTPDEIQNMFNEEIIEKAYIKLHSNLELKENNK